MHIRHFSTAQLQSVGQILPAFPEEYAQSDLHLLELTAGSETTQYKAGAQTVLDYVSGMCALVIYSSDSTDCFYLDRVISLRPGIRFSVLPMDEYCCVKILCSDSLVPVGSVSVDSLEQSSGGLGFKRLYTFLYQEFTHNFYFRGEQHKPYELVYVKDGTLHNLVRGQDILLPRQHFLIIDSGDWHTQYSDSGVSFLTISFWVTDSALSTVANKAFSASQRQIEIFQTMLFRSRSEPYGSDYTEALLKVLLLDLLQEYCSADPFAAPDAIHSENEIVDHAIRIISENIHKKLTLENLASAVHVSVPYLYKLFRLHLGVSPGKYIDRIRIEECKMLLRERRLTMGQIAQKLGFSSLQQFSRQFKSICGVTPTQYVASLKSDRRSKQLPAP